MGIRVLIEDINTTVEWWTDYEEDDRAGEECLSVRLVASDWALRRDEIHARLLDWVPELSDWTDGDIERLEDGLIYLCLEYRTESAHCGEREGECYISVYPIEEHHTQITVDRARHGRLTRQRLELIDHWCDCIVSDFDGGVITICWTTDKVWVVYITLSSVLGIIEEMKRG